MGRTFCLLISVVVVVIDVTLVDLVSAKKLYNGYNLIQAYPTTRQQQKSLHQLEDSDLGIDFWTPIIQNHGVDMAVSPANVEKVVNTLKQSKVDYKIINKDLQRSIDDEEKELIRENDNANIRKPPSSWLCQFTGIACDAQNVAMTPKINVDVVGRYASHKNINRWLKKLPKKYPGIAELEKIGESYEGRDIYMIKIGKDINKRRSTKPIIFIEAGIHAREWLAPATTIYIIDMMLNGYKKDRDVTLMMKEYHWYIIPLANPDGYEFTRTEDRLWRKTRSQQAHGCIGVDGNRNFDVNFGVKGSSKDPCEITYPGVKPFSEPETAHIRDQVLRLKDRIKAYISVHCYSQLLLTPYAFTKKRAPDHRDLMRVARRSMKALKKVHGKHFRYGPTSRILYEASGLSADWAKKKVGIKWTYTYELRPDVAQPPSNSGFIVPKTEIKPSGEEVFASLVSIATDIQK